ncbi:MAG: hypothetical protein R3E96_12670 [Planctomycetota bacterium]
MALTRATMADRAERLSVGLRDPNRQVRAYCIRTLQRGNTQAESSLLAQWIRELAQSAEADDRRLALKSTHALQGLHGLDLLLGGLSDPDPAVAELALLRLEGLRERYGTKGWIRPEPEQLPILRERWNAARRAGSTASKETPRPGRAQNLAAWIDRLLAES